MKQMGKKVVTLLMCFCLSLGMFAGCGNSNSTSGEANETSKEESTVANSTVETKGGKILLLTTLNSGGQYEFYNAFFENACADLGYDYEIVYADTFNDPDANLTAVRNAYTSDVVGIISTVDGGLQSIMEEYPDVYVVGFYSDLDAVFNEDGTSHGAFSNDHFLGCMGDNYISGVELGESYADIVIEKGYKKISTMIFPIYAYPKHTVADAAFRAKIEAYNASASEPIEIVGDASVLEFKPLDASYFMETEHQDLDAVVGFCAGMSFIYPTVVQAKAEGICPADLQIVTGGYEADADIFADCGAAEDKTISSITISMPESVLYTIVMLDNAIQGKQFADWNGPERLTSGILVMKTEEEFAAVQNNSPLWTDTDLSKMAISWEDMKQYFLRYNENATYADLVKVTTTDRTIKDYMD